jgi:hypothetical protein
MRARRLRSQPASAGATPALPAQECVFAGGTPALPAQERRYGHDACAPSLLPLRAGRPHSQPRSAAAGATSALPAQEHAAAGGTPALPTQERRCGRDARASRVVRTEALTEGKEASSGAGFLASPCISSLALGFRTPRLPLLPLWEKGVGGMRGKRAPQRSGRHCGTTAFLALLLRLQASCRVRAGGARTQGISASSGRFFGKPLHFFPSFVQNERPKTEFIVYSYLVI